MIFYYYKYCNYTGPDFEIKIEIEEYLFVRFIGNNCLQNLVILIANYFIKSEEQSMLESSSTFLQVKKYKYKKSDRIKEKNKKQEWNNIEKLIWKVVV